MRIAASIFAFTLLTGCTRPDKSIQPNVPQVAATYQSLRVITKGVLVDSRLAALCRGVTQQDVEATRKIYGPHAQTSVSIFMNDLAANTFGKPGATYPVGSIIIKEKESLEYSSTTQPDKMIKANNGVGGMIKRPPGYDPSHGDWEYFYFENPSRIENGTIHSCVECHSGAANSDHVFGTWATSGRPLAAISPQYR